MKTLHIARYNNKTVEIFDSREEAEAFAAEMHDGRMPFQTTINEIDFLQAFEIREKGNVAYFGKKWDGNNPAAQSLGGSKTSEAKGGRQFSRYSAKLRDGRRRIVGSKKEAIRVARLEASDGWPSEAKDLDTGAVLWASKN